MSVILKLLVTCCHTSLTGSVCAVFRHRRPSIWPTVDYVHPCSRGPTGSLPALNISTYLGGYFSFQWYTLSAHAAQSQVLASEKMFKA
eukprot:scaffold47193_cov58-Attheya_sp.AAC.9